MILEPVAAAEDGWAWLRQFPGGELDEEFARAALEEVPQQERPELDNW